MDTAKADFLTMVLNHVRMCRLPSNRKRPCQEFFSSRQGFVFLILCSFSTFDADPVLALPGMNLNICESGIYEQLLKFFFRRIKEMIIPDILFFPLRQISILVNICHQKEGSACFQHTPHFFQVFLWIRPEIKAFYRDDLIKSIVCKRQ